MNDEQCPTRTQKQSQISSLNPITNFIRSVKRCDTKPFRLRETIRYTTRVLICFGNICARKKRILCLSNGIESTWRFVIVHWTIGCFFQKFMFCFLTFSGSGFGSLVSVHFGECKVTKRLFVNPVNVE